MCNANMSLKTVALHRKEEKRFCTGERIIRKGSFHFKESESHFTPSSFEFEGHMERKHSWRSFKLRKRKEKSSIGEQKILFFSRPELRNITKMSAVNQSPTNKKEKKTFFPMGIFFKGVFLRDLVTTTTDFGMRSFLQGSLHLVCALQFFESYLNQDGGQYVPCPKR